MSVASGFEPHARTGIAGVVRRTATNLGIWIAALVRPARRPIRFTALWPAPDRLAIGTLVAIAIVAALMLFVDAPAIAWQRLLGPAAVAAFGVVSDFGRSGWTLVPTAIVLVGIAALASPAAGRIGRLVIVSVAVRAGFVFTAIALPGLVFVVLKRWIGRSRPPSAGDIDPFRYEPLGWANQYASLPSGHSNSAFAAAVALGALFPRLRPVLWFYAILVAVSRVAVTAHYPSDVVAGALVGGVGALLVRNWFALRRLGFGVDPAGHVRALPGPSRSRLKRVAARLRGQ